MAKREKPLALGMDFGKAMQRFAKTDSKQTDASQAGVGGSLIAKLTLPQGWGVSIDNILEQGNVRMDAEHYDPRIMRNMQLLTGSRHDLVPLSDLADVNLPTMFTRIWADDAEHGYPYLNATDLMSFGALGVPAQVRFLSKASNVKIEPLILKEGMILVTCSGTIGRVFEVPKELDGWVGTHDIVRISPHDPKMKGYIRAYLASAFAQTQILSHTHGGQIDHITAQQVESCLVPKIGDNRMKSISAEMDEAQQMQQKAAAMMKAAMLDIKEVIEDA